MLFILLQLGGIKEGDFIVEISGIDVKWYTQQQVVSLIEAAGTSLDLKVITPMDRNYLKVHYLQINASMHFLTLNSSIL